MNISTELRRQIAEQSQYRCAYCQTQERMIGSSLTIDHIKPRSLGGKTDLENLCQACWDCNLIKGVRIEAIDPETGKVAALFHPNRQKWGEHFRWRVDGIYIIGITAIGRATVTALRLNRVQLVVSRRFWAQIGCHPPLT